MKSMMKAVGLIGGVVAIPCGYVAVKYRPRASTDREFHDEFKGFDPVPEDTVSTTLLSVARNSVIGSVVSLTKFMMYYLEDFEFVDGNKLAPYITSDREGRPLITVCNHHSTLDDPGIISAIYPMAAMSDWRHMRWGICSEELCFASPGVGGFLGCGKALPVRRGGSIYQRAFQDMAAKVADGDWVHVFPEGRVWQEGGTPLRDEEGRWCSPSGRCCEPNGKLGPFKWGVGKLIANSPVEPIVIPFFHMGMSDIMPQDGENQLVVSLPRLHKRVTVKIGEEVTFQDLIEDYFAAARARVEERNKTRGPDRQIDPSIITQLEGRDAMPSLPAVWHGLDLESLPEPLRPVAQSARLDGVSEPTDDPKHPAYVEPACRVVPADIHELSGQERLEEELWRLKLYRDITERLWQATAVLSRDVVDYRQRTPPLVASDLVRR